MNDRLLFKKLIAVIRAGLDQQGYPEVAIEQSFQPTQQGTNSGPTVYLFKVGDKRYGSPQKKDTYNDVDDEFVHTENHWMETTFQASGLVRQDPKVANQETASDLLNLVASILQSDSAIDKLREDGLGILRITAITNESFVDDRDQFEFSPSFDFVIEHERILTSITPVVETVEYNIKRV